VPVQTKTDEASAVVAQVSDQLVSAAITCSFQAEDMVVLHLVLERRPDIPVLFLETGYHFAEVYQYRDAMAARYNLNLINLSAKQSVAEQEAQFGILYQTQPDRCCKLRKVEPLFAALENYDVWFTGLRRVQSPTRANLQAVDRFPLPSGKSILKLSPLADWTDKDVWSFAREHDIPLLSLYDAGYTSIGCEPCTALPIDSTNQRSGRWAGRKLECGIHIAEDH
jgi:phosphoadenosine phosphosulfate reductase